MKLQFRTMEDKDTQQVLILFNQLQQESAEVSFSEILTEEELVASRKTEGCYYYVAEEEGRILAVFRGRQGEGNKSHSAFLTIAIDPNARGKKIAKRFTEYCLEELKEKGITIVRAYVYSNNKPSINTLLSTGFIFAGNVYQHHRNEATGEFVDDIIFHKIL